MSEELTIQEKEISSDDTVVIKGYALKISREGNVFFECKEGFYINPSADADDEETLADFEEFIESVEKEYYEIAKIEEINGIDFDDCDKELLSALNASDGMIKVNMDINDADDDFLNFDIGIEGVKCIDLRAVNCWQMLVLGP